MHCWFELSKSTDPAAHPKGPMRVPRDKLHVLDLHGKGVQVPGDRHHARRRRRGLSAEWASHIGVQGGLFSEEHGAAAGVALVGVMAGVTAGGYVWATPPTAVLLRSKSFTDVLYRPQFT